jgi:hypothetical protein
MNNNCSSPRYYKLKMKVSMLHYNNLMLGDLLGQREEIGNTVMTRKGRMIVAIKFDHRDGSI